MNLTDIFIRRPVLATVINLLILLLGLRALGVLEVRQYPEMSNTVISVTTIYPGASADLVQGFITTPLQQAIAEVNGIDYMTSSSTQGVSKIEVFMRLNQDPYSAASEVQAKVASRRGVLPDEADDPVIETTTGDVTALMYVAFFSDTVPRPQITDYVLRVIQPQLQALPGVAKARIFGQQFAMRIWLDPQRLAAHGLTAADVTSVLRENNFLAGIGKIKDKYVTIDITADTDITDPERFRQLVIQSDRGALIRLEDIARVELGAEDYDGSAWYKGIPSVFIGIEQAPGANPLDVARAVNDAIPEIRRQLPQGIEVKIPYDASRFIEDSIDEVYKTIVEAVIIVLIVVFLTLGSWRAALVPTVAVPLSLIGAAFIMLVLGYSLNLLTLLSMILAIGLVVDDAIIVVENVHRHIEQGMSPKEAALTGARELTIPIIAMTTTLLAVYAPFGLIEGFVGSLFTEFAFTLSAAVLISGVVALTLSPVLSARALKPHGAPGWFEHKVESLFDWLAQRYQRALQISLKSLAPLIVFGLVVLVSNLFMYMTSKNELVRDEDQSILFFQAQAPRTATLDYHEAYARQIQQIFEQFPEYNDSFYILGRTPDTVFGGFKMKPVYERERSQDEVKGPLNGALSQVAGFQIALFPRPSIPVSSRGLPLRFVILSARPYEEIAELTGQLIGWGMQSGKFMFLRPSVSLDRPLIQVHIDRDRAGDLGVTMQEIGRSLSAMLGGAEVNRFNLESRSYKVITQVPRTQRLTAETLQTYYVKTAQGDLVPLSSLISLQQTVEPSDRKQFQQLNAITIEGISAPGVGSGDALQALIEQADKILPKGFRYDFEGESREYVQQGNVFFITFALSLIIIYLVLAAQFESWRDPAIILVSVPLATAGALMFITLGASSINLYTKVGLITLIGVVAKNGILIVEFANQLQIKQGLSKRDAVQQAAAIRLRPIIMTSVSLIMAMVPLLIASGPGAASRFDIGLTIAAGLGIGTLFTLFILPAFYLLMAKDHSQTNRI